MRTTLLFLLAIPLFGQTTTIGASTTIVDRQGNLFTGSVCWGSSNTSNGQTIYTATANYCFSVATGTQSSYVLPNATYAVVWINESAPVNATAPNPLLVIPNVTLSGTPISVGTYLQGQFGLEIGATYYYWQVGQNDLVVECNGNAVVLPGSPLPGAGTDIKNTNGSTACTVTTDLSVNPISGTASIPAGAVGHFKWSENFSTWISY